MTYALALPASTQFLVILNTSIGASAVTVAALAELLADWLAATGGRAGHDVTGCLNGGDEMDEDRPRELQFALHAEQHAIDRGRAERATGVRSGIRTSR